MSASRQSTALSRSQQQIWVSQRLHPDCPLFNMAFAFVFETDVDEHDFRASWDAVVASADVLRCGLSERDGRPELVSEAAQPTLELVDLSGEPDPETAFHRFCDERAAHSLVRQGPGGLECRCARGLVDSVLVRLGPGRTAWYLNQHHLICDAASTVLLYEQVGRELAARQTNAPAPEPLGDWRETHGATAPVDEATRDFWRLAPEFPSPAPYGRTTGGRSASRRTTRPLPAERLDELAATLPSLSPELSRLALLVTLTASWLRHATGESRFTIDLPVAGRTTRAAKRSLGPFLEIVPLAIEIEPGDSFRALARRSLERLQALLPHASSEAAPASDSDSRVILNYLPMTFGALAGTRPRVRWVHSGHAEPAHVLRVQVHRLGGDCETLHLDANEHALPAAQGDRCAAHFDTLLDALTRDFDLDIDTVDVRTEAERRELKALRGPVRPAAERTVVDLFLEQAEATPDAVALRQDDRTCSFAELSEASARAAAALRARGTSRGDLVALRAGRSLDSVVALLGVLRAGAAYLPLPPHLPNGRVERLLENARPDLLVEAGGLPSLRAPCPAASLEELLASRDDLLGAGSSRAEPSASSPHDLAYVLFTSGSTGTPKAVEVEHLGLSEYLLWARDVYVGNEAPTFPLFTSLGFDLTVTSLFLPLITGGTLDVYPETSGPVDTALIDVLRRNRCDIIKLTPSHASLLLGVDASHSVLRRVIVGGEDFKRHLALSLASQFAGRLEIFNEYGPTEGIVGCMLHRFDAEADTEPSVPIGLPSTNVQLEVLNPAGVPVAAGAAGELWISRPGLARGYRLDAEATRNHFVTRPGDAHRSYRTGDAVRWSEGRLHFLGRLDRQVKIAGHRIELAEVEAALLRHPAILEAHVAVRERGSHHVAEVHHCRRCGLPSNYPQASFDSSGLCSICIAYDEIEERAQAYFRSREDLEAVFAEVRAQPGGPGEYDCMMLLSGGKDSTYALSQLVGMGLSVYCFSLDNGFISEGAKANMRRVTDHLGVPLELATTPVMNDVFRDSLERFSNVCHGCYKVIYTLSLKRAHELGIPVVVTGLSRGQMFETRLTQELFRDGRFSPEEVDAAVLAARKVYHRADDAVSRSMDVSLFRDDRVFQEIQILDFYRYCDAGLKEVLDHLRSELPWVRPEDTGRSTNCLINDIGIHVHKRERGFHNYALPYSWDVRLGHKTRDEALAELNDEIDLDHVRRTLRAVGYDERSKATAGLEMGAFVVADSPISAEEIRDHLAGELPAAWLPQRIQLLQALPLTDHGKLDEDRLPWGASWAPLDDTPLDGPVEEYLATQWQRVLDVPKLGATAHFFEAGGTSLGAIEIMVRLCDEFDIELPLEALFETPVLRDLAGLAEDRILADVADLD